MIRAGVLLLLVAIPTAALADIYMWCDNHGVKHYTNSRSMVPSAASAAVVLEETTVADQGAPAPAAPVPPPRQTQVAVDDDAIANAYAEGWQRAMDSSQQTQGGGGAPVTVQISGPLVAAGGGVNTVAEGGPWGPSWVDYNSPALVTTSFDRGRSRHLTLRMLMQDQFAIDREGPYLIVDRFPPLGPNLVTVMPNGLPLFVRPGSRFVNRVITR